MWQPPKLDTRPVTWTNRTHPTARDMTDQYTQELKRQGLLPWEDGDAWYAHALPDPERWREP